MDACPLYSLLSHCDKAASNNCNRCPTGKLLSSAELAAITKACDPAWAAKLKPATKPNPSPGTYSGPRQTPHPPRMQTPRVSSVPGMPSAATGKRSEPG